MVHMIVLDGDSASEEPVYWVRPFALAGVRRRLRSCHGLQRRASSALDVATSFERRRVSVMGECSTVATSLQAEHTTPTGGVQPFT